MNRRKRMQRAQKRKAEAQRMAVKLQPVRERAIALNPGFFQNLLTTIRLSTLPVSDGALMVILFPLFIFAGIAAPILVGQSLARLLTSVGISTYLTIWLVPGSSILVVVLFWKIYKRLGITV